ncbi:MAG: helix-turn-helix transcriptional regulator [Desulfovibrionaceae bacterium]
MGFSEELRQRLAAMIGEGESFPNKKRMADALEVDPSQLNRFLSGQRGLTLESLGRMLDKLGARICFPNEHADTVREVRFVPASGSGRAAPGPLPEDYLAVPMAAPPVAAGPGTIPDDRLDGWVLVWRQHESVRHRSNLVAVQLGPDETSMVPALHPGDIVLVDRADREPEPAGRIMLVTGPDGAAPMVKRVSGKRLDGDLELVFYSDNSRLCPPQVYRLGRDYGGDLSRAVAGAVVWAWSDVTRK